MKDNNGITVLKLLIIIVVILFIVLITKVVFHKNEKNDIITKELSAKEISEMQNKQDIYGAIIYGYNCEKNNAIKNWKIFYADNENIYIISENFLTENDCPKTKQDYSVFNNRGNSNYEKYELCMIDVIDEYSGSENITDEKLKKLNGKFFKYLEENNIQSTYENMKIVAYMMDTDIWKEYCGNNAEYAIGGPTLEMFFNSFNEKYKKNYTVDVKNDRGYAMNKYSVGEFGNDSLYTPIDEYERGSTRLASPSDYGTSGYYNPSLWFTGSLSRESSSATQTGIRPLVCLKSDVKLIRNNDGSFKIQ